VTCAQPGAEIETPFITHEARPSKQRSLIEEGLPPPITRLAASIPTSWTPPPLPLRATGILSRIGRGRTAAPLHLGEISGNPRAGDPEGRSPLPSKRDDPRPTADHPARNGYPEAFRPAVERRDVVNRSRQNRFLQAPRSLRVGWSARRTGLSPTFTSPSRASRATAVGPDLLLPRGAASSFRSRRPVSTPESLPWRTLEPH